MLRAILAALTITLIIGSANAQQFGKRILDGPISSEDENGNVTMNWAALEKCAAYEPRLGRPEWAVEWGQVFQCKIAMAAHKATIQEMKR